jgi:integrase
VPCGPSLQDIPTKGFSPDVTTRRNPARRSINYFVKSKLFPCTLKPVEPVDDAVVDATVQHLNRHVAVMVRFQQLTDCRPGEACAIRRWDIDMGGSIWLYRPEQHKTAWRGKTRVVAIGPQAQKLLREIFTANFDDYLFCPRRAVEELHATRS